MLSIVLCLAVLGADEQQRQADAILAGKPATVETLLAFVQRRQLALEDHLKVQQWLRQLCDDRFQIREQATARLFETGVRAKPLAEKALRLAEQRGDSEWIERLNYLQQKWADFDDSQLIWAAAVKLKTLPPTKGACRRLFDCLPTFTSRFIQAPVREAAWHHARDEDLAWIKRRYAADGEAMERATALCLLAKFGQQPNCVELLRAEEKLIRLAAARVLSLTEPGNAVDVLLALIDNPRHELRAEARYLLRALFEARVQHPAAATMTSTQWQQWVAAHRLQLKSLEPEVAFRWGVLQLGMREDFDQPMADLKTYRSMKYTSTPAAKAVVKAGRLYLDGNHDEGDQSLSISAKSLVSTPTLSAPFIVKAGMGGQIGNNVGWHVGVAVGNAKILFHPVYSGGAFRIEHITSHDYFVANTTMPFTPQADAIYPTIVRVAPAASGGAKLDIEVQDAKSDKRFRQEIALSAEQIGPIDRISLVRSGRQGGAAIFDYLEIRSK